MYKISCLDVKRCGFTYLKPTRHKVLATLKRLLEHGTKYYGDKIMRITIERLTKKGGGK